MNNINNVINNQGQQQQAATTTYPNLLNLGVDCCKQAASAELAVTRQQSILLSVRNFIAPTPMVQFGNHNSNNNPPASVPGSEGGNLNILLPRPEIVQPVGTISVEARHYFQANSAHSSGFMSARVGNSGNIGMAWGNKYRFDSKAITCSTRVGACYNVFTKQLKPVFGLTFELNV
jgi:hypothetical protein